MTEQNINNASHRADRPNETRLELGSERAGNDPFRVPDGYFDHLDERVMEAIDAAERSDRGDQADETRRPGRRTFSLAMGAVAALALVVIGIYVVLNLRVDTQQQTREIVAASHPDDQYLDLVTDQLSSDEIEDALAQLEEE